MLTLITSLTGVSGLATVLVIGNRKGFGKERFEPHNILVTFMGMSMLWVGWYGFNAGTAPYSSVLRKEVKSLKVEDFFHFNECFQYYCRLRISSKWNGRIRSSSNPNIYICCSFDVDVDWVGCEETTVYSRYCMYICMHVYVWIFVSTYVCMHASMHDVYVCTYYTIRYVT